MRLKDTLHCIHQGLGPIVIASLVTHHFEETGVTLGELDKCLQDTFQHYKQWCKTKRNLVAVTSSQFTALRFGRENFQTYPALASCYKGAMVKGLIYWTAEFLLQCFRANPTPSSRLRACCASALAQFQFHQDSNGPWLSQDVAKDVAYMGRTFLLLYQKLACEARVAFPQRRVYKVIPKFHSFLHMCLSGVAPTQCSIRAPLPRGRLYEAYLKDMLEDTPHNDGPCVSLALPGS